MAIPKFDGIVGGTGYTCTGCHAPFTDRDVWWQHQQQCDLRDAVRQLVYKVYRLRPTTQVAGELATLIDRITTFVSEREAGVRERITADLRNERELRTYQLCARYR